MVPVRHRAFAVPRGQLADLVKEDDATPSQLALARLKHRSPVMLLPGTSSAAHLEDNVAAVRIELSDAEDTALTDAV